MKTNELPIVLQLSILENALKPNGFDKLNSLDKSILFWHFQTFMNALEIEFVDKKTSLSDNQEKRITQYAENFSKALPQTIEELIQYLSADQEERETSIEILNSIKNTNDFD